MKKAIYISQFYIYTLWVLSINAQHPQPSFINYTSDDGLASSEVHIAFQDHQGYMWFGTDNGLSRFDGYEFKNYSAAEGLVSPVVFDVMEDGLGQLWVLTMSGQIFIKKQNHFLPFRGNKEILKLRSKFKIARRFQFNSEKTMLYVSLLGIGISEIDINNLNTNLLTTDYGSQLFLDSLGIKLYSIVDAPKPDHTRYEIKPITIIGSSIRENLKLPKLENTSGSSGIIISTDSLNYFISNNDKHLVITSNKHDIEITEVKSRYTSYISHRGKLWLGSQTQISVVESPYDLNTKKANALLRGSHVLSFFEDIQGGIWVTTVEDGIFYCSDSEVLTYNKTCCLQEDFVKSIAIKSDSTLMVAHWKEGIGELNYWSNKTDYTYTNPFKENRYNYDIEFDQTTEKLIATPLSSILSDKNGTLLTRDNSQDYKNAFSGSKISSNSFQGNYLITKGPEFHVCNLNSNNVKWSSNSDGKDKIRVLDANFDKNGNICVARMDGLWNFIDGEYIRPEGLDSLLYQRIEAIEFLSTGEIILGTKGNGVIIGYLQNETKIITTSDGLTANNIENIHVDSLNQIWVGTLNGLNRIRLTDQDPQIKIYTKKHGLPSNEIKKVRTQKGITWVATNKGLCKLTDLDIYASTTIPTLNSFLVNNSSIADTALFNLQYHQNNIQVNYVALDYKAQGDILYRYKLNADDNWTTTKNTSINFSSLSPDDYAFEVQAKNEDGIWSSSAQQPFVIKAPFWQAGWFQALSLLGIFGLSYFYYRYRVNQLSEEMDIKDQVVDLERSALQAQMNPHFIFNILNSIQSAITTNDSTNASLLLAKFAKLVRTTLNNTRAKKISLSEEINYLESYLYLEKVRHKNKFIYEIHCDPTLDQYEIVLPPMLTQPFVENAIKHGLRNEIGGQIDISYQQVDDVLQISVKDNGVGFKNKSNTKHQYESVGMKITEKRLQILERTTKKSPLTINHLTNEAGESKGTEIILNIKIHQSNSQNKLQSILK